MELKKGYKQTEAGVIPEDWEVKELHQIAKFINGKAHEMFIDESGDYKVVNSKFVSSEGSVFKSSSSPLCPLNIGDITMVMSDIPNGKALAKCFLIDKNNTYTLNQRICALTPFKDSPKYLFNTLNRNKYFLAFDSGTGQTNLRRQEVLSCPVILPPKSEQTAIANALSDANAYITSLEKLIEKKRQIKQGAMEELLKPKDGWETKRIGDVALILDNLRKPLNDNERIKMKGDIPYCGANNIVDYVNDYVIDDDIILIAEDGGNFDQYKTRPIAYRMAGKSWVNNHAHIVKSKPELDQNFLFYSVVHKNILDYINGGTRAKLNKGELVNIEINIPPNKKQQAEISRILDDIESDIIKQMQTLDKAKSIKEGMMQQLLTGKIRLK